MFQIAVLNTGPTLLRIWFHRRSWILRRLYERGHKTTIRGMKIVALLRVPLDTHESTTRKNANKAAIRKALSEICHMSSWTAHTKGGTWVLCVGECVDHWIRYLHQLTCTCAIRHTSTPITGDTSCTHTRKHAPRHTHTYTHIHHTYTHTHTCVEE